MQLSSRILTALAVLILAVAVVAVRAGSTGTVEAATGTIDVLNVGTCYTTSTDVFAAGDCDDGDGNAEDTAQEGYNVGDRDANTITKVDSVFATYAIDPKTSGDQPRAIVVNSDLIKISIEDTGRDQRTGVLYRVGDSAGDQLDADEAATSDDIGDAARIKVIGDTLKGLKDDLLADDDNDATTPKVIQLTSTTAYFSGGSGTNTGGTIDNSGDAEFDLLGTGNTTNPMASVEEQRGKVYWFGTVPDNQGPGDNDENDERDFVNLGAGYITLDEDQASGDGSTIAPWMKVTASIPSTFDNVDVEFIYYQTSGFEDIVGGAKDGTGTDAYPGVKPIFVDDEANEKRAALVLRANGDGDAPAQNLWLKEDGRFSGRYEGYLRLTDSDGDGKCDHDDNDTTTDARCNWGRVTGAGTTAKADGAAVLGVESGPISITYKNSKGDTKSLTIQIDKDAPAIQVDSPAHEAASKDDSPDLIGSFSDGGGSGLRADSFKFYAHNESDSKNDSTPVWNLRVNLGATDATKLRGYVCVDTDDPGLACDDGTPTLVKRADYSGYSDSHETFGIIRSDEIYKPEDTSNPVDGQDEYKTADAEDFDDGDMSGTFDTVVRIDFPPDEADDNRYNHEIDLQAVVMDIAGNIGFSDSEASDPTFIHDYGTATKDGKRDADGKHNVIGWYSRHTYYLDDVDPKYMEDDSATGYYLDADGDPMKTSSGLMVVFDGKIDPASVGVGTFDVMLDNGNAATVIDVETKDEKVYLQIEEELAPDATPKVDLAAGQSISDRAGNESTDRRLDGIELSDGILPTFTVTLSGGTGLNEDTDGEGPSELTKGQMTISISANEAIQGSPKFAVVCSNLTWGADADNNVGKFASNRTNALTSAKFNAAAPNDTHNNKPATGDDTRTMCPDHVKDASTAGDTKTYFDVAVTSALARPGNNWEYQWSNLSADQMLEDGKLSVIVWGRDRSSYKAGKETLYNYSASTANFVYDTDLKAAWEDGGELVPAKKENVFEMRPFVLLDFGAEKTTVDVSSFKVDGMDHTTDLMSIEDNQFVWWPEPLAYGTYKVEVEANDAANNQDDQSYTFTVKERSAFVLNLLAGWNSVSFPANPVDRALHAVFTNPEIDQVIGWDATEPVNPWRMATRVDGVWTTSDDMAALNDVEARYGYWVHSEGFITQAAMLAGKGDRTTDGQPNPSDIPTDEGWNFVGVVDVDGDQTQDDAGETLRNSAQDPITAAEYLGNYTRAYTWDHINNTWDVLKKDEGITIGSGVWVYYTKGHDIAP